MVADVWRRVYRRSFRFRQCGVACWIAWSGAGSTSGDGACRWDGMGARSAGGSRQDVFEAPGVLQEQFQEVILRRCFRERQLIAAGAGDDFPCGR